MHTRWFVLCAVFVSCAKQPATTEQTAEASAVNPKAVAKGKAEEAQRAFLRGDYGAFVDATHPLIVEENGGREKMIAWLTKLAKESEANGIVVESATVSEPSDPQAGERNLYITLPVVLGFRGPDGPVTITSGLLGVSTDGGKNWHFLDADPGRARFKKKFTDLPDSLPIPKTAVPVTKG